MKKKAYVDIILIGFILLSSVLILVGTNADNITWKNKYFNLKKVTDSTALALAKHYNENQSEDEAEEIADGILDATELGVEIKSYMSYTWDFDSEPNSVVATITNYRHENFWYKFLGKNEFIIENVESKANIIDPVTANDFLPIAVNGCNQNFTPGDEFDFLLKAFDTYVTNDNAGFYALSLPGGGQSSFAHFKNVINHIIVPGNNNAFRIGDDQNFYIDGDEVSVATVDSSSIENDVKQVSQAFDMTKFTPINVSIAVLDCDSTAANPTLREVLQVRLNSVGCASCCTPLIFGMCFIPCIFADMLNLVTNSELDSFTWENGNKSCNSNALFGINLEVLNNDTVELEY